MFPTFWRQTKDRKRKWGRSRCPLTGKRTEGVLLPAYPTIWTGNRKWWRFWPEFLTAQGILLSWLSVCKLSADYLSREPVGIWPIPWSSLGEQEDSFRSLIIITKTNSFTSFIKAEIIMISCLNYFGRHLTNCLFSNSDNYIAWTCTNIWPKFEQLNSPKLLRFGRHLTNCLLFQFCVILLLKASFLIIRYKFYRSVWQAFNLMPPVTIPTTT